MNVFDLDAVLISRYESFARSFTNIRSTDLKAKIDAIYGGDVFWPEPLISLNPKCPECGQAITADAAEFVVARKAERDEMLAQQSDAQAHKT